MAAKPLSKTVLDSEVLKRDRKSITRYDLCGLGDRAIYMGTSFTPRKYYIPYSAVTHVFKRVAVSPGSGRAFLTPVLYLVVRYDGGQEFQTAFKYLTDADRMLKDLEEKHPDIHLVSPDWEKKQREKQKEEERLKKTVLSAQARESKKELELAGRFLEKSPELSRELASSARRKRQSDNIASWARWTAILVTVLGLAAVIGGILLMMGGGNRLVGVLMSLLGLAAAFLMFNSHILPVGDASPKRRQQEYAEALSRMEKYIGREKHFPLPARYAHPVVCRRMVRILLQGRAKDTAGALDVLREDLRAADSSASLEREDYEEVVLIKPLFLVADYQ